MGDKLIEIINNTEDIKSTISGSIHASLQDTAESLISAKNDLVDNLETKGITGLTGDETLTELVPEVLNIQSINEYFNIEGEGIVTSVDTWLQRNYIKNLPELYIPQNTPIWNLSYLCKWWNLYKLPKIIFGENITSMYSMCANAQYVTSIDTSGFETKNVTTIQFCFENCYALTSLDLSHCNFGKLTTTQSCFANCRALMFIDIRTMDLTSLTAYSTMFGSSASNGVPDNCEIIVADQTQKDWVNTNFSRLTNVQTVAEYEASLGGE